MPHNYLSAHLAPPDRPRWLLPAITAVWIAALIASGLQPFDRATWWMEVAPVLIAIPLLWATRRSVPFTSLAMVLIGFHGSVLILGGTYSYARVPIGFAVQDWLDLARNPYDRFAHFVQGFVPAIVFRELLIRFANQRPGIALNLLTLACCLSLSALYELIEFGAALALGQGAEEFLGTQGDVWDTQWDMLMCLMGAITSLLIFSRLDDKALGLGQSLAPASNSSQFR